MNHPQDYDDLIDCFIELPPKSRFNITKIKDSSTPTKSTIMDICITSNSHSDVSLDYYANLFQDQSNLQKKTHKFFITKLSNPNNISQSSLLFNPTNSSKEINTKSGDIIFNFPEPSQIITSNSSKSRFCICKQSINQKI